MTTSHDRLCRVILQTAGTANLLMAVPTNETGAPPDDPIDLDAWFGPGPEPERREPEPDEDLPEHSALVVAIGGANGGC